jgi:hypothetical protein
VAARLGAHFVGVAADADGADPRILKLAMQLEDAAMLPFVIFTDESGAFKTGYSGVGTAPRLVRALDDLGVPAE